MAQYTILLFGPASSVIKSNRVVVEASDGQRCDELKAKIIEQYPMLEMHMRVGRLVVNQGFVSGDELVDPSLEIALITMVSGG